MPASKSSSKPVQLSMPTPKATMRDPMIRFVQLESSNWKGYTLIEGFPGMGLAGTIAGKYLVENLKFREVGHLHSDLFMPIIRIHDGVPVFPSRIYVNDSLKLIVLISEQVIPRPYVPRVSQVVTQWILQNEISRVISLAGIQTGQKNDMKVYAIAANEKSKASFKDLDVEMINEGITTGITALILLHLKNSDVVGFSLLGSVSIGADYKAAAELIKRLNKLLKLNLKVEPLYEQAKKTEKEIIEQLKQVQATQQSEEKMDEHHGPQYYA